jgi:hypothetical protein
MLLEDGRKMGLGLVVSICDLFSSAVVYGTNRSFLFTTSCYQYGLANRHPATLPPFGLCTPPGHRS